MRYIPFNIMNGRIGEPSPLPAYIADVTWYGRIKQIRVGWFHVKSDDKDRFRNEMLRLKDVFADHPEWRKEIKKLRRHKDDPAEGMWPKFMYFPLPTSDFYWVEGAAITRGAGA